MAHSKFNSMYKFKFDKLMNVLGWPFVLNLSDMRLLGRWCFFNVLPAHFRTVQESSIREKQLKIRGWNISLFRDYKTNAPGWHNREGAFGCECVHSGQRPHRSHRPSFAIQ